MTPIIIVAGVLAFFLLLPVLDWLVEKRMTRSFWRDRTAFLAHRAPQTDDAFLADAKAQAEDAEVALVARSALAYLCSTQPEMIHSGDTRNELASFSASTTATWKTKTCSGRLNANWVCRPMSFCFVCQAFSEDCGF